MVATTPAARPHVPWYIRFGLPIVLPSGILAALMLWSVTASIATSNWAQGLGVLTIVALPALLVGIVFARLTWLPSWLANILSAALGIAWSIQQIGPILAREVGLELGPSAGARIITWGDKASEILIRTLIWSRVLQAGGRGEDIILFVVALALLMWALGYATGWLLFRSGWVWWVVVINAFVILVNYTFASPKPNQLFFIFLGSALLLIVHQTIVRHQQRWSDSAVEFPEFMSWRFLLAGALFCAMVVLITSILPGNVTNTQVARAWRTISLPLTAAREGWEKAFSTINAPPGSVGGGFATTSVRAGGPRSLGDAEVMRVTSSKFDYWRAVAWDKYTGTGWQSTVGERARSALGFTTEVQARSPLESGDVVPQADVAGRTLITQTVTLANQGISDIVIYGGQFSSANIPVLVQNGVFTTNNGQTEPNFDEISAVFSEVPLRQTNVYTVETYISVADEQSLRNAGTDYPEWVRGTYLELPDTVTPRTRALAQQIVQQAGAANSYDQARAIQDYLRRLTYDESRPQPPEGNDWADYFLFTAKRGYCDDFATAMIVLLRSLNVPARLAQGYAGGTLDPQINTYIVRESIGHSWPEVYFPNYGWQRFEPTPASYASVPVRPASPDNADEGDNATPPISQAEAAARRDELLSQEDVLGLNDRAVDTEAIRKALEESAAAERLQRLLIGLGILAIVLLGIGIFFYSLRRELRGLTPASAAYVRLGRLATWAGLGQEEYTTPLEFSRDLSRALPDQTGAINRIVGAYVAERYRPEHQAPPLESENALDQDVRAVRKPLLTRLFSRIGASARPKPSSSKRRRK